MENKTDAVSEGRECILCGGSGFIKLPHDKLHGAVLCWRCHPPKMQMTTPLAAPSGQHGAGLAGSDKIKVGLKY